MLWSAYPCELVDYYQQTAYGAEYHLQHVGNDADNVETLQFVSAWSRVGLQRDGKSTLCKFVGTY